MTGKEVKQIIEICLPDSAWERATPGKAGVLFGKHLMKVTGCFPGEEYTSCNGHTRFEPVPPTERVCGSFDQDPIMIRCQECGYTSFPFAASWKEAVWEWRLIAYISSLWLIDISSYLRAQEQYVFDELRMFLPEEISFSGRLKEILASKYDLWQRIAQKGTITGLPFWPEHGFAVAWVTNIDKDYGLKNLAVASGLLLKQMEDSFQKAIKRSHQLAGSASEFFHPRSRRKRT